MRSLPRARRKAGYRAASPNRHLSLIIERNKIDVAQSENCTHVNFRLCDVYFVVRSAKQKKDNFFYVEMAKPHFISEKNVLFHISVGRTLKLAKRAKHEKYAKSGKFSRLLSYLFIYSKSDTTLITWC